jgi:ectoine hydroxylase-related dioxygenase (phytanoyl-CoA dioxygenase family)
MQSLSVDLEGVHAGLQDDGYVVLRQVVSKEPLEHLSTQLADAYARADRFKGGGSITGHLNSFPGAGAAPVYDELVEAGVVDTILRYRAGKNNAIRSTLNYNMPGSVPQHWHIDGLYVEDFVICNVAVVDTTLHNGAIDLLPGTNRQYLPYWKWSLQRTSRLSTRIEMKQGDVLLRKSNLWHRGMPNKSATPRPMLSITFGEASAPDSEPFGGEVRFYPNWYNTSRLGVLRERVYVAAPLSYSAYRFAKSLRGQRGYTSY